MTAVVRDVLAVPAEAGYFTFDQRAIQRGAERDGFAYVGTPVSDGFSKVSEPGRAVSVVVELDDGTAGRGDCVSVVYAGAAGRDPPFRTEEMVGTVTGPVRDALVGRSADDYFGMVEALQEDVPEMGTHSALRYGVSGALLDAAASARRQPKAALLADEYDRAVAGSPPPVYGQSGELHHRNADKMILKELPVLPHGSFHDASEVGEDCGKLVEYVEWLVGRIDRLGPAGYRPRIHVDVYGRIGAQLGPPHAGPEVLDLFARLESAAGPCDLTVEAPLDAGSRDAQIGAMADLREALAAAGVDVDIAADEWCNTREDVRRFAEAGAADLLQVKMPDLGYVHHSLEAVLACSGDVGAFLGGSANETDVCGRTSAHVALAADPAFVLARPGVGVDAAVLTVTNEMRRALARMRNAPA